MTDNTTNALILNANNCGCTPEYDPWRPKGGSRVKIKNNTDSDQLLNNITPGLLNPAPNGIIALRGQHEWSGTVGRSKGTYDYEDGTGNIIKGVRAPRAGTIDPG